MKFLLNYGAIVWCVVALSIIPGCGRIIDWGAATFYQGEEIVTDYSVPQAALRQVNAYDQFTTIADFVVLWLSDAVRTAHVDMYTRLTGKNPDQKKVLLRRQHDENKHFIMFYLLTPHAITLGKTDSLWAISLLVDDQSYDPIEIKPVHLDQMYAAFFGKRFSRFMQAYQIKFDARTVQDTLLLGTGNQKMALHFRSIEKELKLVWELENGELLVKPEPAQEVLVRADISRQEHARKRKKIARVHSC